MKTYLLKLMWNNEIQVLNLRLQASYLLSLKHYLKTKKKKNKKHPWWTLQPSQNLQ